MSRHQAIVVGSGIIGASFAYHLAKSGAEVKVLEAGPTLGGLATSQSWAWINASWGNAKPYFELRVHSMREWIRCDRDVPGLTMQRCGSLLWDLPPEKLRAFVEEHASWGYDIHLVDRAEILRREPALHRTPDFAAYAPGEAAVDPTETATQFLKAAASLGADVITGARVKWLIEDKGRIAGVMTPEGRFVADTIILAAGTETNTLLHTVNRQLDVQSPPGLLIHTEPAPELLTGLVLSPQLHVRQTPSGSLIAGSDHTDEDFFATPKDSAARLMDTLRSLISGTEQLSLERFTVGNRPMPADGHACVGYLPDLPGLYIAVTHSGVTLAPALGSLGTVEVLTGERHELLLPFSPGRLQVT
jgi:glycine/D-amino acid oxidase-like deaminating enzyme